MIDNPCYQHEKYIDKLEKKLDVIVECCKVVITELDLDFTNTASELPSVELLRKLIEKSKT